jgi:hypothetical protein
MGTVNFTPTETDLTLYQGNNVLIGPNALTTSTGSPMNCTGGTLLAQIRVSQNPTSALICAFTVTWINQSLGTFNLTISAATMASAPVAAAFATGNGGHWDLTYTDGNTPPNVTTFTYGTVSFINDVSN